MQAWRVAAASAIGTSHVASGTKCQDAHGFGVFDASGEHILILVVSDGAGSAKHSGMGAQCAVSTVRREIETYFDQSGTFDKLTREVAASWLDKVQQALRRGSRTIWRAAQGVCLHAAFRDNRKRTRCFFPDRGRSDSRFRRPRGRIFIRVLASAWRVREHNELCNLE